MGNRVVGLDIGTHAVRAVELAGGRGKPVIQRMGQVALPYGAVVAGEVVDPHAVSNALRRLWREVGFRSRSVAVGVANARVVARMTDLPALPDEELRSSLRYQVQDLIPIPVDEAELDFQVVQRNLGDETDERVRVLLVAAHRDMLQSMLEALRGAGLTAARIDLVPFALIRTFHDPAAWLSDEALSGTQEVIVGAGAGVTNVVVHQDGVPQFVRTLSTGGSAVTEALAGDLSLDIDQAEALKRGFEVPSMVPAGLHVDDVARAALAPIVNDVAGSLDFHVAQAGSGDLRRVILSGGGGRFEPMRSLLAEQLGVPVVSGDSYGRVDATKVKLAPELIAASADLFSVAIGLALAGVGGSDERGVSLLPRSVSVERAQRRQTVLAGAGVGAFALLLVGASFVRSNQVDAANTNAQRAEDDASALQSQVAALSDIENLETEIAAGSQTVATVLQGDIAWTALIQDIAAVTPDDVWLESLNASRGTADAPGSVQVTATGFEQPSTARWLLRLGEMDSLQAPWIGSSSKSGEGERSLVEFNSTATLAAGALSDRAAKYTAEEAK